MSSNVTSTSGVIVTYDDDAPPIVRLLARTLRNAARLPELAPLMAQIQVRVGLRSHNTPQSAIIDFGGGGEVEVLAGAVGPEELSLTVDLDDRFAAEFADREQAVLGEQVLAVLRPRLPDWRESVATFWEETRNLPGMPAQLTALCESADSPQEVTLGSGDSKYTIAGSAESLARIFSGADDLLTKVLSGSVKVRGTFPQLSAMTGASWKVRYDV